MQFPDDLFIATDTAFPASIHIRHKLFELELQTLNDADFEEVDIFNCEKR